ncbi:MAG: hypothetical protein R2835_04330 [Thermomicrobiales bacterium]
MSFISPVDDRLAVVYLPLMPVQLVEDLQDRGWRFIEVPDEEFEPMACNVLAVGPERRHYYGREPRDPRANGGAGCRVRVYPRPGNLHNRAGGPTCL